MRILFLVRLFYPHIGGVEKHVYEISKKFIQMGYDVNVVTEKFDKNLLGEEVYDRIKVYRIPNFLNDSTKKFKIWMWMLKNKKIIDAADVIHAHDVFFWYIPYFLLNPRKKVFVTFHGYETKFPIPKKTILIRRLSNFLVQGSINVGAYIEKWYSTKADYATYGGLDLKSQNYSSKVKTRQSKLKILFIGRLEEDTGVQIYLETLKLLRKKGINFELEVCGDGTLRNKAEKFGKVHGFVRDLDRHIDRVDIVFASSYLSILESLAMGKVVFAVYQNELKKDYLVMSPFAKYINIASNPDELAEKILDSGCSYNIESGVKWARKQTWDKVANIYLRLWKV